MCSIYAARPNIGYAGPWNAMHANISNQVAVAWSIYDANVMTVVAGGWPLTVP